MTRDFEIILNALLMLADVRAPIMVKDIPTDTPMVRRYLAVFSAGDYDLADWRERIEWQCEGCDADTEQPYYSASLDAEEIGGVARLIPEDGDKWAHALKAVVSTAFGNALDAWRMDNVSINNGDGTYL